MNRDYKSTGSVITEKLYIDVKQDFFSAFYMYTYILADFIFATKCSEQKKSLYLYGRYLD